MLYYGKLIISQSVQVQPVAWRQTANTLCSRQSGQQLIEKGAPLKEALSHDVIEVTAQPQWYQCS